MTDMTPASNTPAKAKPRPRPQVMKLTEAAAARIQELTKRADSEIVGLRVGSLDDPTRVTVERQYGVEGRVADLAALARLPSLTTAEWGAPKRLAGLASHQHPDHD